MPFLGFRGDSGVRLANARSPTPLTAQRNGRIAVAIGLEKERVVTGDTHPGRARVAAHHS